MATVKVVQSGKTARTAKSLVGYLTVGGTKRREGISRFEAVTATNGVPTSPGPSGWQATAKALTSTAQRFPSSRARHEVHHVVISFGPDELDPSDPDSIYKALAVAHAFADEAWPTRQTFAVCQRDGEGGKIHVHLAVANLDMLTGKAARGTDISWTRLAPVLDAAMLDFDMHQPAKMPRAGIVPEFKRRGHTKYEHESIVSGVDPRLTIIDAIEAAKATATSLPEYVDALAEQGIVAELTEPNARQKYGAAAYTTHNVEGEQITVVGSKLGRGAGWRAVTAAIAENTRPAPAPEPAAQTDHGALQQGREATAAAALDARLDAIAEASATDSPTPEGREGDDEFLARITRRRYRQKTPEKLTPARAAFLKQKGVITRDQAREYGA